MHNVVLLHVDQKKRTKIVMIILLLQVLHDEIKKIVTGFTAKRYEEDEINWERMFGLVDVEINSGYKELSQDDWERIIQKKYMELWNLVEDLLYITEVATIKIPAEEETSQEVKNCVKMYVDGAYNQANNKVGYSVIVVEPDGIVREILTGWEYDEYEITNSLKNIYGELRATLRAMKYAVELPISPIEIVYDYIGIERYAELKWASQLPVVLEYVNQCRRMRAEIQVFFRKVTSHSGNRMNDMADEYAKRACDIRVKNRYNNSKYQKHSKEEVKHMKNLYKSIFKVLVIVDIIYMNNNLNDLSLDELLFNTKMKVANLDDLSEKMYEVAQIEVDDELVENMNDIIMDLYEEEV